VQYGAGSQRSHARFDARARQSIAVRRDNHVMYGIGREPRSASHYAAQNRAPARDSSATWLTIIMNIASVRIACTIGGRERWQRHIGHRGTQV
jgi:hypothetical protein